MRDVADRAGDLARRATASSEVAAICCEAALRLDAVRLVRADQLVQVRGHRHERVPERIALRARLQGRGQVAVGDPARGRGRFAQVLDHPREHVRRPADLVPAAARDLLLDVARGDALGRVQHRQDGAPQAAGEHDRQRGGPGQGEQRERDADEAAHAARTLPAPGVVQDTRGKLVLDALHELDLGRHRREPGRRIDAAQVGCLQPRDRQFAHPCRLLPVAPADGGARGAGVGRRGLPREGVQVDVLTRHRAQELGELGSVLEVPRGEALGERGALEPGLLLRAQVARVGLDGAGQDGLTAGAPATAFTTSSSAALTCV